MKEKIGKFFNVRQEESMMVSYLLLHYFFQGFGLALYFTVANALFLSQFPIEKMPLVYIGSAVAILVLGRLYEMVGAHWSTPRMLRAVTVFIALSVLIFYIGSISFHWVWLPFALYVWYDVIYTQIDIEFWGLSSVIFDVRQAKRLYSLISVGDVPAKLLGYLSVAILVPSIGLINLLLIATASFIAGALLLNLILSKLKPGHFKDHEQEPIYTEEKPKSGSFLSRFFKTELVLGLALLYFISALTFNLTEFSFLAGVEHRFHSETELAFFFAQVFAVANAIVIIFKLFLSGKMIERLGVKKSLLSLPVFLLVICAVVAFTAAIDADETPVMWLFAIMVVFTDVFQAVLYEPLFLALFQPLSASIRHRAHNIINEFVYPLGIGVCGLALYIGVSIYHEVSITKIDYVLLVLAVCWVLLVLYTSRKYMQTLKSAINKRMIGSGRLKIGDPKSLNIILEKLNSPFPDEVIYTAEILSKSQPELFEQSIPKLLSNNVLEIRRYTLDKIDKLDLIPDSAVLDQIIANEEAEAVLEMAIKVYCSKYEDIVDRILPMLDRPELSIRSAAIKGFLKSGDVEPMILGGQKLLKMLQAHHKDEQIAAIKIIGDLGFKNYYKPLLDFLHLEDYGVKKAAIEACGKIANPKLIGNLIPGLDDKILNQITLEALGLIGEPVLDYILAENLVEKYPDECIKLCGRIGGQKATDMVFTSFMADVHAEFLDDLLKTISRLRFDQKIYHDAIISKLNECIDFAYVCLLMSASLENAEESELMLRAINDELNNAKNRIFVLMSLIYDRNAIYKARNASFSAHKELRANALEYLENLIDRDLKLRIFPILEELPVIERADSLTKMYHGKAIQTVEDIITFILQPKNNVFLTYTQALVLYLYTKKIDDATRNLFSQSAETLIKQCASIAPEHQIHDYIITKGSKTISKMKTEVHHHHETLLEVEKILILKSTSMFSATPENNLVGIAGIAREERKTKGQDIFKKDELGNCLYIICEGNISIHIQGKQLSELHSRDIFGELALLDPEPRSATATALDDCLLLRIDQEAFAELIEERPEVAQGIMAILSKRIRAQNELIRSIREAKASIE